MIIIDGEEYYGEKEMSAKHGLSVHWFRYARYNNNSPIYYKLNDKIYYKDKDVEEWLKQKLKINK